MLNNAGKYQLGVSIIIAFAVYVVHSKINLRSDVYNFQPIVTAQLHSEMLALCFLTLFQYIVIIWMLVLTRNLITDLELDNNANRSHVTPLIQDPHTSIQSGSLEESSKNNYKVD